MEMTQAPARNKRLLAIIGVGLALLLPWVMLLIARASHDIAVPTPLREAGYWAIAALVLFWATRIEGVTPAMLGFKRPGWASLGWAAVFAFVMIMLIGICYALIFPALGLKTDPERLKSITQMPVWMIFLLCLRAGLVEEFLFRFYSIERLMWLTSRKWIASLIPAIAFIALHAPSWGLAHLIPVAMATAMLTLLYWWRRDFWCSALAHFLADFIPFAGMALAAGHAPH